MTSTEKTNTEQSEENVEIQSEGTPEVKKEPIIETKKEVKEKHRIRDEHKIRNLEQKLNEANAKTNEVNDLYLRTYAEFDNFRKRTMKEKEGLYADSVADTVSSFLPVMDNFERALMVEVTSEDALNFKAGIEMIFKQMKDGFDKLGVTEIDTSDKFDPNLHNAVMHIEDEAFGEQQIVEAFQKGYMFRDKVIRHSMVKVAN